MGKQIIVLIIWLLAMIVFAGCARPVARPIIVERPEISEKKDEEPEPAVILPPTTWRSDMELLKIDPNEVPVPVIELIMPEPNEVEPNMPESDVTQPDLTEPTEPNQIKPVLIVPNDVEPVAKVSFHDQCAEILSEYVDADGMVDYARLRRHRLRLWKLLDVFDELDPNEYESWPREDKIAFWINVYNIQMLNIIVENYPIESSPFLRIIWGPYSILHIKGIWTEYKFMVMDEEFTLSAIEQRFFREQFSEPRVFFALTRCSFSSPKLRNEPYYGYKLYRQLDGQAEKYLSDPHGFKIDRDRWMVYLSAVFQSSPTWYGDEFLDKYGTDKKFKDQKPATRAVLNFISNYIAEGDVSFLEVSNYLVKYMKYDWTLNDSSR